MLTQHLSRISSSTSSLRTAGIYLFPISILETSQLVSVSPVTLFLLPMTGLGTGRRDSGELSANGFLTLMKRFLLFQCNRYISPSSWYYTRLCRIGRKAKVKAEMLRMDKWENHGEGLAGERRWCLGQSGDRGGGEKLLGFGYTF